jgi:O-antigen/teichoic acid export membrane protein
VAGPAVSSVAARPTRVSSVAIPPGTGLTIGESVAGHDVAAETTGSTVASGGTWQAAARVLPQLYVLAITIVAARVLGPDGMGRQSYIAFVALSVTLLFTSPLPLSVMRFTAESVGARRVDQVRPLLRWALRVQVPAAVLCGAILVVVALAGSSPPWAWALAGVSAGVAVVQSVPSSVLAGLQRWRETSSVGLLTGALAVPLTIGVLLLGGGITGMFAAEAGIALLNLIGLGLLVLRRVRTLPAAPRLEPQLRRVVVRYSLASVAGSVLTFVIWRRSEFFFLAHYSTQAEIALYSIPYGMTTALATLPQAFGGVVSPAFATLHGAGARERLRSGLGRALRLMLAVSLPAGATSIVLGPRLLDVVYGSEYAGARPVLRILLAVFPLVALYAVAQSLVVGLGKMRFPLVLGVLAAILNISFDRLLIPGHDAVGAALANSAAQALVTIPTLVYATRLVGGVAWYPRRLLRLLAATALTCAIAAGAAALLPGWSGVAAGAAAALAAYLVLAPQLRVLDDADAAWLQQAVGHRLPASARRWVAALGGRGGRPSAP